MVASIICISSIGVISSFLLIGPFIILMSHLIYRLLFIGSLSKYPRKLSGVDGSLSSFICMLFMFSNFYSLCYAFHFYFDSEHNTYKPDWAEYLGQQDLRMVGTGVYQIGYIYFTFFVLAARSRHSNCVENQTRQVIRSMPQLLDVMKSASCHYPFCYPFLLGPVSTSLT